MIMKNSFLKNSVIAHRGIFDNKKTVENTLEAFKKALKKGYAIELDLHLTKDNKIIVFHDNTLDRLTGKKGKVESLPLNEIKKLKLLDVASIPTLDEVLDLVDGKVPLLIELKDSRGFTLEKEVSKRLNDYKGEFAIQSFDPRTILWFRLFKKDITRGLLIGPRSIASFRMICTCKPDFINVNKVLLEDKKVKKFNGLKLSYLIDKDEKDKYSDKCDNIVYNI